jgi:hypothetical protein
VIGLYGRYLAASVGLMATATANGLLRERTYGPRIGENASHAVSLVPMAAGFAAYTWALEARWPLPTRRSALAVGALWAAVAFGFEAGLGRAVERRSWRDLLDDYDPRRGRPGTAVLAVTLVVPGAVRAARRRLG